jgi:hypothetical protein
MSKNLYFIPLIERALRTKDRKRAIHNTFLRIIRKGREPGYEQGFEQFRRFMEEVKCSYTLLSETRERIQPSKYLAQLMPFKIIIEKDGRTFGTCQFDRIPCKSHVHDVISGAYRLKMETGRVLWEGFITEKDCIWKKAFPGEPLKLAADTGEHKSTPSKTIPLLEEMVNLHLHPGIETGLLVIELKDNNRR